MVKGMQWKSRFRKLRETQRDLGKIGGIAGVTAVLPIVGSTIFLSGFYQLGPWLQENREVGVVIFVGFMTVFSGLALLATNILGVVSGFAFDFHLGVLAQIVGLAGASSLMFLLAKKYASANFLSIIEEKPKMRAIHGALLKENAFKTLLIVTLIRLSPAMPFALTNFIISASGISFRIFLLGTVVGMMPRASALVFVGSSLSELNFSEPQEAWLVVLGIAATVLAIIVVGMVSKRALNNLVIEPHG
jgi:uncharacterized membrane protein YdjX (TVP38/TMEM64 family)